MKYNNGFASISIEEACQILGGYSPVLGQFFRQLGYATGIVSRYIYDLFHSEEEGSNRFWL